jgi:hypothetical protein
MMPRVGKRGPGNGLRRVALHDVDAGDVPLASNGSNSIRRVDGLTHANASNIDLIRRNPRLFLEHVWYVQSWKLTQLLLTLYG